MPAFVSRGPWHGSPFASCTRSASPSASAPSISRHELDGVRNAECVRASFVGPSTPRSLFACRAASRRGRRSRRDVARRSSARPTSRSLSRRERLLRARPGCEPPATDATRRRSLSRVPAPRRLVLPLRGLCASCPLDSRGTARRRPRDSASLAPAQSNRAARSSAA
jgi:hypothetical protein